MAQKIERILEGFKVGEGPHWDVNTQSLYFVDCYGHTINKYNPATNTVNKASVAPKICTFIIPVEGKAGQFVVGLESELQIISWDGESDKIFFIESLHIFDHSSEKPDIVLNDAKCDSYGRLWTGTRHFVASDSKEIRPIGTLYSYDSKYLLKEHVHEIIFANGLAFNEKAKKFYFIDSLKGTVDQFDFDLAKESLSNRQELFTLKKHNIPGMFDGMTIDTDGNLWVAVTGGSRIIKIDGQKPETLLETINMPAEQVTSATFGGPNLDELYVTTATIAKGGREAPPPPANGAIYKITGLGVKGLPASNFKIQC